MAASRLTRNWVAINTAAMPFTLAHPAAVLPFRRFTPRSLNFPALVSGSLSPDAGYCFARLGVDKFSHGFVGSLAFCLPVGVAMVALFYGLRSSIVGLLPVKQRDICLPLCRRPAGSPLLVILSVMLGVWTHLLWDSFTNKQGWFVERWEVLRAPLIFAGGHEVRVCHVLWYGCSCAGIAWLYLAYARWSQTVAGLDSPAAHSANVYRAVLVGMLVLPIGAIHHLVSGMMGLLLVAALSSLLVAVAAVVALSHVRMRPSVRQ